MCAMNFAKIYRSVFEISCVQNCLHADTPEYIISQPLCKLLADANGENILWTVMKGTY